LGISQFSGGCHLVLCWSSLVYPFLPPPFFSSLELLQLYVSTTSIGHRYFHKLWSFRLAL
jgi:hypothetical protein